MPLLFLLLVPPPPADDSGFLNAAGVKIHYQTMGRRDAPGGPVLLIHGLAASGDLNWRLPGVVAALAKDHFIILPDLPGHGKSDKPDDHKAYGAQMAEDMILLLDHLQIKKAHVAGYSLGGMVAAKLMVLHPERIQSAALCGMGFFQAGSPLQKFWENLQPRQPGRAPEALLRGVADLAITEKQLKNITLPVRVIVGDRDPVLRLYVLPLKQIRPDWKVVEIKDSGHLDCVLKKQFHNDLASWLRNPR